MSAFLTMDEANAILEEAEKVISQWISGILSVPEALAALQTVAEGEVPDGIAIPNPMCICGHPLNWHGADGCNHDVPGVSEGPEAVCSCPCDCFYEQRPNLPMREHPDME